MKICINKLSVPVRLGVTSEERAFPQIVTFNIKLLLNNNRSAQSDDIKDTVDYMGCINLIKELAVESSWALIEALNRDLARLLFGTFELVSQVEIETLKYVAPEASSVAVLNLFERSELE